MKPKRKNMRNIQVLTVMGNCFEYGQILAIDNDTRIHVVARHPATEFKCTDCGSLNTIPKWLWKNTQLKTDVCDRTLEKLAWDEAIEEANKIKKNFLFYLTYAP